MIRGLVEDAGDQSKIREAVPNIEFIRQTADVVGSDFVVINLDEYLDALPRVRQLVPAAHIVVYGSEMTVANHEQEELGLANEVLTRPDFFSNVPRAMLEGEEWEA